MGRVVRLDYADASKKTSTGASMKEKDDRRVVIDKVERKMSWRSPISTGSVTTPSTDRPNVNRSVSKDDVDGVVEKVVDEDGLDPLEQLMEGGRVRTDSGGKTYIRKENVCSGDVRSGDSRNAGSGSGDDRSKSWSEDAQRSIRNKQRYEERGSSSKYGDGEDRSRPSIPRPRTRPITSSSSSYQSSSSLSSYQSSSYQSSSQSSSTSRPSNRTPSPTTRSSIQRSSSQPYEATLYFGNLAYAVTEESLKAAIERFAGDRSVAAVRIATDLETGRKKGFGYVDVYKKEVAAKVIMVVVVYHYHVMIDDNS